MKAFPSKKMVDGPNDMLVVHDEEGMDLRDYFAAAAMTGLLSNPSMVDTGDNYTWIAEHAYAQAAAMMKVREQAQP